jgi:two-component system cell cycle sensor histidine kinase PleC
MKQLRTFGKSWFKGGSLISQFTDYCGTAITRQQSSVALRAAKVEAELASKAKSEFIANMSHELRTPLNAIIGFSDMLQRKSVSEDERVSEYASYIKQAAEHLLALINGILDVSKIQAGKLVVEREDINPDPIIRSCLLIIEAKAKEKNITVTTSLGDGKLQVYADPLRLKQILINVMSNAVKFTSENGRVSVEVHRHPSGFVCVEVCDNGPGMSPEEIATALRPFGQVHQGINKKHEGTGLGLPISAALARLHGGNLSVDSEKGKGTCVRLFLQPSVGSAARDNLPHALPGINVTHLHTPLEAAGRS